MEAVTAHGQGGERHLRQRPQASAAVALRNLAVDLLRLAGRTTIAPATRWMRFTPARPLAFLQP